MATARPRQQQVLADAAFRRLRSTFHSQSLQSARNAAVLDLPSSAASSGRYAQVATAAASLRRMRIEYARTLNPQLYKTATSLIDRLPTFTLDDDPGLVNAASILRSASYFQVAPTPPVVHHALSLFHRHSYAVEHEAAANMALALAQCDASLQNDGAATVRKFSPRFAQLAPGLLMSEVAAVLSCADRFKLKDDSLLLPLAHQALRYGGTASLHDLSKCLLHLASANRETASSLFVSVADTLEMRLEDLVDKYRERCARDERPMAPVEDGGVGPLQAATRLPSAVVAAVDDEQLDASQAEAILSDVIRALAALPQDSSRVHRHLVAECVEVAVDMLPTLTPIQIADLLSSLRRMNVKHEAFIRRAMTRVASHIGSGSQLKAERSSTAARTSESLTAISACLKTAAHFSLQHHASCVELLSAVATLPFLSSASQERVPGGGKALGNQCSVLLYTMAATKVWHEQAAATALRGLDERVRTTADVHLVRALWALWSLELHRHEAGGQTIAKICAELASQRGGLPRDDELVSMALASAEGILGDVRSSAAAISGVKILAD